MAVQDVVMKPVDGEDDEITKLDKLDALGVADVEKAIAGYKEIADSIVDDKDEAKLKEKEIAITKLGALYKDSADLRTLITDVRPFLGKISKAKGGQLLRKLVDSFLALDTEVDEKVSICKDCIEWTTEEKRTFLRQALEVRLVGLYLDARRFDDCLKLSQPLIAELKRLDDKPLLVEVQLKESRAYHALKNYPRSKAALVSARTTANAIYCPPKMQAALDLMSGTLHAQDGDFKTGYSYFYESFEGYDSVNENKQALFGLKYMLLCKILLKEAKEVKSVINSKYALKYSGRELESLQAIATASLDRSLADFEKVTTEYKKELEDDAIIKSHLAELYDSLLQGNLMRIVEPFSCVEISHVAKLIDLPLAVVETKLSQMILDKQLNGILDQGAGCLEIFPTVEQDGTHSAALQTIEETSNVVDSLEKKSRKLV